MKKVLRSVLSVCLLVCMALSVVLFAAACDNTPTPPPASDPVKYTVTVLLPDDTVATGVKVQMGNLAKDGTAKSDTVTVDAQGKAELTVTDLVKEGVTQLSVWVTNIPQGYLFVKEDGTEYNTEGLVVEVSAKAVTVKLKAEEVVSDPVGTQENPAEAVLDEECDFTITLDEFNNMQTGGSRLAWETEYYYFTFTPDEDGDYDFILVSECDDDELQFEFIEQYPEWGATKTSYVLEADTEYVFRVWSDGTFDGKAKGDKINYTLTVQLVENNPVALQLGVAAEAEWGDEFTFTATVAGEYLFTATGEGVSIGTSPLPVNSKILALTAGQTIELTANGICTLTVTNAPAVGTQERPAEVTVETAHEFEMKLEEMQSMMSPAPVLTWNGGYYFTFTTSVAGHYKVTVTSSFDFDDIETAIQPADSNDYSYPDVVDASEAMPADTKYIIFDLKANTEYIISLETYGDYTDFEVGDAIDYTALVEYLPFGSQENPTEVTVGTEHEFDIELKEITGRRGTVLTWGNEYYIVFTTGTAGTYKISLASTFVGDDITIGIQPADSNDYSYPDMIDANEPGDADMFTIFGNMKANTAYMILLDASWSDYSEKSVGDKISYTLKVEFVEDADEGNGTIALQLGVAVEAEWGDEFTFTATEAGDYVITVTGNNGYMLDGGLVTTSDKTVTLAAGQTIVIEANGACSITVTKATA